MAEFRTACVEDLVERLRTDLGGSGGLADRLERAFAGRDPELVALAMDELAGQPDAVRAAVHDAILCWLFGGDPAAGLRAMRPASPLPQ